MRPPGEIRQALLEAAVALTTPEQAPTMRELARYAQVGVAAAKSTIDNMYRAGVLVRVRTRKVGYRAKPVAEYCPRTRTESGARQSCPLREVVFSWPIAAA